jgi:adenosylcobinamide-phosphate synthase
MNRSAQIACALALDAAVGDPRWMPHPAKLTGRLAQWMEPGVRRRLDDEKLAGSVAAAVVTGSAALAAVLLTGLARRLHPRVGDAASVLVLWSAFAARDLADHALVVHSALERGDLAGARSRVARMVGRDVSVLDEAGVVRAAVESVAENTVDGVTAPLFYAFIGGPVAAAIYKAVSTLDSTFGYRNERYASFGWASARADDLANYVPARLSLVANVAAAALLGLRPADVLRMSLRDGTKHASPNSGIAEAAMAGALGVQLGGPLARDGRLSDVPTLGDTGQPLAPGHIKQAVRLMIGTTVVWAGLLAASAALAGWSWSSHNKRNRMGRRNVCGSGS